MSGKILGGDGASMLPYDPLDDVYMVQIQFDDDKPLPVALTGEGCFSVVVTKNEETLTFTDGQKTFKIFLTKMQGGGY